MAPLISVMLPNFNHGRFLAQSIESVLAQTWEHFEIIFVDDGSTDDSREIAARYAARDARLKLFYEPHLGAPASGMTARAHSIGELVLQFGADDYLAWNGFFAAAVDGLRAHPRAAGFFGKVRTISTETGDHIDFMGSAPHDGFVPPQEFLQSFLRGGTFVPGTSAIFRRELLVAAGGYDNPLGPQADFYLNHLLGAQHGMVFSSEIAVCARLSERGASFSSAARLQERIERLAMIERMMRENAPAYSGSDRDWADWRASQIQALEFGFSRPQALVARAKSALRAVLPPAIFRWTNLAWRHSAGRALKALHGR